MPAFAPPKPDQIDPGGFVPPPVDSGQPFSPPPPDSGQPFKPPGPDEIDLHDLVTRLTPYQKAYMEGGHQDPGMANTTDFLSAVANDPVGFLASLPNSAASAASAPGKLAYAQAADVVSKIFGQPEYGGNIEALERGESELPAQKFIASAAGTNPKLAVAANLGESASGMAPLAGVGLLPAWAGRLVTAGFSAQMLAGAPKLFEEFSNELYKPKEEQDPGKLARLWSDVLQTGAFTPMLTAHATRPTGAVAAALPDFLTRPVSDVAAQAFAPALSEVRPATPYERKPMEWGQGEPAAVPPPSSQAPVEKTPPMPVLGPNPAPPGAPIGDQRRLEVLRRIGGFEDVPSQMLQPGEEVLLGPSYVRQGDTWRFVKPGEGLTPGDEVEVILPDGKPAAGTIFGADAAGNAVLRQPTGAELTLPEKLAEVPNADQVQGPVAGVRSEPPGAAPPLAEGASGEVRGPAGTRETQETGLSPEVETTTGFSPEAVPVQEVPLAKLKLSADVPNFKSDADETTGVVKGQQLEGSYQRIGTAPIVAWERLNGELEVITGRHRLDLARRSGEKTIPAQIVREADGFTKENALTFDAEANIRDGQGTVEDYAHYFRNSPQLTQQEAGARGLLSRVKGKDGWSLGRFASDDLYALWADDKIKTDQAVAIGRTAPGNPGLQALGVKQALKGKSPADIENFIRVVEQDTRTADADQFDMFGRDDSAIRQAEEMASRASKFQKEIANQIRAVQSAAKRPEAARKLGVNVEDPQGVLKRVSELKLELERWQNWSLHPDLVAKVRGGEMASPDLGKGFGRMDAKINRLREIQEAGGKLTLDQELQLRALETRRGQMDLLAGTEGSGVEARVIDLRAQADEMMRRYLVEIERGNNSTHRTQEYFDNARVYYKKAEELRTSAYELERRFLTELETIEPEPAAAEPRKAASPQLEMFSPVRAGGGELGGPPPLPEDNPQFSVIDQAPMELPEAVQWVKILTGSFPKVKRDLGTVQGMTKAGVFRFSTGEAAKGEVALRASIFELLSDKEKADLRTQADQYAQTEEPSDAAERRRVAEAKYQDLLDQATEAAKTRNPVQALKTIWHEIGHVVDWLPEHIIEGRGNILGRIASLKNFLKHVLPFDPSKPAGERLTPKDKTRLKAEAERQLRAELGPIEEIVKTIIVEEPEWRITGITPEDVKNILRESAGRETPELTRWFAEQPDAVKAQILRKAMRGILDERLAALGKREQVGTRRVEKTVREKTGREPTPDEIKQRFADLISQEMRARNLADLKTIKSELEPLIAWWRGTESMEPYFKDSPEMYAEAFSAFANNPAAVAKRAPTYYQMIHNYLDRKASVKAVYDAIQADIRAGSIMPKRVKGLYAIWHADDAKSLDTARLSGKPNARDFFDSVAYHFDRTSGPIYRTARGYQGEGVVREARANYLYRATEHERFLAALNYRVGNILSRSNLDWSHDLGEYLFHKRIVEERFNLANPLGWTSKNSGERLSEMRNTLGPERWAALESAASEWHQLYNEFVRDPVVASGMFSKELNDVLLARAHYATFSAIKGVPDTGIESILKTQFGQNVTPHIYRQIGNLGEIKNPATATVLKGLSLISAVYRNDMKRQTVRMIQAQDPRNIAPAKMRFDGRRRVPVLVDGPKVGTVVYLEDGKPQAFYTRKVIADALNNDSPSYNQFARALMAVTGQLKGVFTQYNPGFWLFNFARDTMGFSLQLPGVATPFYWLRNAPRAWSAARASVKGRPNPVADEALRRKLLISRGDPRGTWGSVNNEYELKVASYGFDPAQWNRELTAVERVVKVWNWYREIGQTVERMNKIGGMLYLDQRFPNMPDWKKREIVRERSGSPNFLERGANNGVVDLFWLFYNPWKEGVRSIVKAAREDPVGFSTKAAALMLMPTVLQASAYNGWLGEEAKRRYRAVKLYQLSNYLIPYTHWVDQGNNVVGFLRLPLFEPARVLHGMLFQALTGQSEGILSHAGGQLPGVNPFITVFNQWLDYMMGKNPVDPRRNANLLTDLQQAARGGAHGRPGEFWNAAGLARMSQETWNNLGGTMIYRFKNLNLEQPPETATQKWLNAPVVNNMLGRWYIIGSGAEKEQAALAAAPAAKREAEINLGLKPMLEKLVVNYPDIAAGRTSWWNLLSPAERSYLMEPTVKDYLLRHDADLNRMVAEALVAQRSPIMRQVGLASSLPEKAAILRSVLNLPK